MRFATISVPISLNRLKEPLNPHFVIDLYVN